MGFNTTVVLFNDALHQIRDDKEFGRNLYDAALSLPSEFRRLRDVPAGNHCNAAYVVEQHHADSMHAVLIGGNMGYDLGYAGDYSIKWPENARNILNNLGSKEGLHVASKKYETIVKNLLKHPDLLPLLLGVDKSLDRMIEKRLKGKNEV